MTQAKMVGRALATGTLSALAPSLALAQKLAQGPDVDLPWWRVVLALMLCLILAGVAAVLLRARLRAGARLFGPEARRLRLIESIRLSHQVDLCLVECDDHRFLIAAGAHGVRAIPADAAWPPTAPTA